MNNTHRQRICIQKKGLTIFEIVIYFSMLAVLTVTITSSLMSLFKSYNIIHLQQDVEISAIQIIDKLHRDIRDAEDVLVGQSSFGTYQGSLSLSILGATTTETYTYQNASNTLQVLKNGQYIGNLSKSTVQVDSFMLRYISGTTTKAVKIELSLLATSRYSTSTVNKKFYTTVQLRN